jgi:hypothetical protein
VVLFLQSSFRYSRIAVPKVQYDARINLILIQTKFCRLIQHVKLDQKLLQIDAFGFIDIFVGVKHTHQQFIYLRLSPYKPR